MLIWFSNSCIVWAVHTCSLYVYTSIFMVKSKVWGSNLFPEVVSDPLLTVQPHHEPEFQRPVDKKTF